MHYYWGDMKYLHFTLVLSHAAVPSSIRSGQAFGGGGGSPFQDFSSPYYVSGVVVFVSANYLEGFQFVYSNPNCLDNNFTSGLHGSSSGVKKELYLSGSERINKVQVIVGTSFGSSVQDVQFFTTSGRSSESLTANTGTLFTEEFGGCTLGYITGRVGAIIDQLMFQWYC